jgi:hypothetical protein
MGKMFRKRGRRVYKVIAEKNMTGAESVCQTQEGM